MKATMVTTFNVHSRVLELERELISAKADFAASKTLRTKLGTSVTAWVTAIVSAVVLLAMALGACVTVIIGTVSLATELVISFIVLIEFCVLSLIKMFEAIFIACATVWAIVCSLLEDLVESEEDQMFPVSPMCTRIPGAAPPPSPIPSSPDSPVISSNVGFLELRDIRDVSGIQQVSWPIMCKALDMHTALDVYKAPIEDVCRGLPYASKEQKRAARIARRAARF